MKPRVIFPILLLSAAPGAAFAQPLTDYVVTDGRSIEEPLAEWSGAAEPGGALFTSAGCAACHDGEEAAGADELAAIDEGEMRLMIAEPRIADPDTEMPGFYAPGEYGVAPDELVGRTRLTALEIEQIIAWLKAGAGR